MFVVRKKGQTGPAPTLLYGYGGFDVSLPRLLAGAMAWRRPAAPCGGELRGGGEYGKAWHDAGG